MIKTLLSVLTTLIGSTAFSANLTCMTNPMTSTFIFEKNKDANPTVSVIHHHGTDHAPIYNGVATGYSIKTMQKRFDYVTKMGDSFTVELKPKNCQVSDTKISCFQGKDTKIGELEVEDYYFSYYKQISETPYGTFTEYHVSFQYRVDSIPHDMGMVFYEPDCQFKE